MVKKMKKAALGLATFAATTVLSVSMNNSVVKAADKANDNNDKNTTSNTTVDNTAAVQDNVEKAQSAVANAETAEEAASAQKVLAQSKIALTTMAALDKSAAASTSSVTSSTQTSDKDSDTAKTNSDSTKSASGDTNNGEFAPATREITAGDKSTYDADGLKPEAAAAVKAAGIDPKTLSDYQKEALNKVDYTRKNAAGNAQMTYSDFKKIADALISKDGRYAIPYFNAKEIQNMPAAYTIDAQTGKLEHLDVWDSWPVQDVKTGYVANWNGYQLVVAMMGVPEANDNHIYLLYNKYGDNNLANWKNAGPIFGYNASPLLQQWSGSAVVNTDGSIQLFYTQVDGSQGSNHQKLASVTLLLSDNNGEVKIEKLANDHVVFEGDGYHYQTYKQWIETNKGADNIAMRDAHVIEGEDGHRYLVFEASTGTEGYQGLDQIYNWSNYGGDDAFNIKSLLDVLENRDIKSRASWANAAIGILRLTDDETNPQVAEVYSPLLTATMVSDEIERPDVVKLNGKYYLFAATRLNRGSNDHAWMAANDAVGDNVAMVGYVSDSLNGKYVPLNESGVVLTASVPANWRTATYSYYAVPVEGHSNWLLITSYITNRSHVAGDEYESTWAPSFILQVNDDNTTTILAKMTNQGDWIWDDGSENPAMMGTEETAALPGERDKVVNWDEIGYKSNYDVPSVPEYPEIPSTPKSKYGMPGDPLFQDDTPETPKTPETPRRVDRYNNPTPTKSSLLPQTGNVVTNILSALGMLLASAGMALGFKGKND